MVENNVRIKGLQPKPRLTLADVLSVDVLTVTTDNHLVDEQYMAEWKSRHKLIPLIGQRVAGAEFVSEYSYYTCEPFKELLLANITSRDDRGVVVSLLYSTGEFTVLTLVNKEEAAFIEFCLKEAAKPITMLGPEYTNIQDVVYV